MTLCEGFLKTIVLSRCHHGMARLPEADGFIEKCDYADLAVAECRVGEVLQLGSWTRG